MTEIFIRERETWSDPEGYDRETVPIAELEAISIKNMSREEYLIHWQKINDAYWRRRMAMRTADEVKRNVCAP